LGSNEFILNCPPFRHAKNVFLSLLCKICTQKPLVTSSDCLNYSIFNDMVCWRAFCFIWLLVIARFVHSGKKCSGISEAFDNALSKWRKTGDCHTFGIADLVWCPL
jgi:hypothetical protein